MLRISSYTFGCKLNQSETEAALAILNEAGYEIVPWDAGADLYVINTCTVTSKGEQKARRLIRKVQQFAPQAVVLAAGCYAVLEQQKLEALGERVCALPDQPARLCELLARQPVASSDELLQLLRSADVPQNRHLEPNIARPIDFPEADFLESRQILPLKSRITTTKAFPESDKKFGHKPVPDKSTRPLQEGGPRQRSSQRVRPLPRQRSSQRVRPLRRVRPFLKIQDGCNRTCSFCRIRIARGPSRSLSAPLLVQQLQQLEAQGCTEAVITGVHINSYHCDETGRYLGGLLQQLLRETSHIRLRLSSLEPESLNSERAQQLLQALSQPRICPHFHISVQSGSEYILRQMRRCYTANVQQHYIERLRELRPSAFFSCDVIVGFPGEREEDYEATCKLLQSQQFGAVHAFSYSPRPGTVAFEQLAGARVQESIVKRRMQHLQALAARLQQNYVQGFVGRRVEVLLEELHQELNQDYWYGYSENYIRTRIAAPASDSWEPGDLVDVELALAGSQGADEAHEWIAEGVHPALCAAVAGD